jgi:hypothetical protein
MTLFRTDPDRCLAPAEEYARYRRDETSAMARAEQRGDRLMIRFRDINRQQAVAVTRWQRPPDILE